MKPGSVADIAVMRLLEGEFVFVDSNRCVRPEKRRRRVRQKLVTTDVVGGGEVYLTEK